MKERELRECATCAVCGQKIGASGLPMFWRVKIESYVINLDAVKRKTGLEMMLGGSAALAAALGPDEEMATAFGSPIEMTVCAGCETIGVPIVGLAQMGAEAAEKKTKVAT